MEESSRLYTKEIRAVELIKARSVHSINQDGRSSILSFSASPLRG
jgi:hypothetical protein